MLERMTYGPPQQQHRQLQMLKGLYKTETCRYDATERGCRSGNLCCFRHSVDTEHSISQAVHPIRRKVFNELYNQNFALPLDILHEIGKVSDQEHDIRQERKEDYMERLERRRMKPRRSRSPMSASSNEPRINRNRTPTPPGAKQDNVPAVVDVSDINAERQRDNTSVGLAGRSEDEHSETDVEAAAPIEANDNDINMEAIRENEQTPLLAVDNSDVVESTPQLVNEAPDDAMALEPETETVVEIVATYAGVDVATSLQEGIVDA